MTPSDTPLANRLRTIIQQFTTTEDTHANGTLSLADKMQIILSESSQALAFVLTIEDEFDIELDDDDVDLTFFTDFDVMQQRVGNALLIAERL
jgi:acyl carrier protein